MDLVQPGQESAATATELERARWPKTDAFSFISGAATYIDDLEPPGTLHMAVVRSPVAHGHLLGVDLADALAIEGVVAAVDGREAARHLTPMPYLQNPADIGAREHVVPALAIDRLRWLGEPVAVVVASTPAAAATGAAAAKVRYEALPPMLGVDELLGDGLDDGSYADRILAANHFERGEAGAALESAPHRLDTTIRIGRSSTAPMEPRGYLAAWDAEQSRLTVHTSHQQPFQLRWEIATMLGLEEERVRVVVPQVGGSFGLKMTGFSEEPLVCLMSRLTGRPVKFIESRAECFLGGGREQIHRVEVGHDADGRLLAMRDRIIIPVGAASTSPGWRMAYVTAATVPGAYLIPHVEVSSEVVLTNQPPWHSCRGYGKDGAIVVMERLMDMVAARLGLDPAEVRRRNLVPTGHFPHRMPSGYVIDSGEFHTILDRALALADYAPTDRATQTPTSGSGDVVEGVGIAFEITPEGGGHPSGRLRDGGPVTAPAPEAATVSVSREGRVEVRSGVTNPGGGNDTSLARLAAEELGVDRSMVTVVQGDTDLVPTGTGHASSRATAVGGAAVVLAARAIAERLRRAAADRLEVPIESVALAQEAVLVDGRPVIGLADLCAEIHDREGDRLCETRSYVPTQASGTNDTEAYRYSYPYVSSGAFVARVRVDRMTGRTTVTSLVGVHDCGRVIEPTLVEGQLHGAMAMGAGLALFEESLFDDAGTSLTSSFKHYLAPRANDLPAIVVEHHETLSPNTLLGAKGAGEAGVGGAMAAIGNAVADAVGNADAQPTAFPLTPPRVLALIDAADGVRS